MHLMKHNIILNCNIYNWIFVHS